MICVNYRVVKHSTHHKATIDSTENILHIKSSEYIGQLRIIKKDPNAVLHVFRSYSIYSELLFAFVHNSKVTHCNKIIGASYRTSHNMHILLIETQCGGMNENIGSQFLFFVFIKTYRCTQLTITLYDIVVHIKKEIVHHRVMVYFSIKCSIDITIVLHQISYHI